MRIPSSNPQPTQRGGLNSVSRRCGFSLVEVLFALTILALAGSVMLLTVESTIAGSSDSIDRALAEGMAKLLLDEVMTQRYVEAGASPLQVGLGPGGDEPNRSQYDDSDDYHGYVATPPKDRFGQTLGWGDSSGNLRIASLRANNNLYANWRQRVEVYYVSAADHSQRLTGSSTSNFRAIEVHIEAVAADGAVTNLATQRRVYATLPTPP